MVTGLDIIDIVVDIMFDISQMPSLLYHTDTDLDDDDDDDDGTEHTLT